MVIVTNSRHLTIQCETPTYSDRRFGEFRVAALISPPSTYEVAVGLVVCTLYEASMSGRLCCGM